MLVLTFWLLALTPREGAEWVVLAGATLAAAGGIARGVQGLRRRWERDRHDRLELLLIDILQPVLREMTPNGGASLVDKMTRIEFLFLSKSELNDAEHAAMKDLLDELTARVDDVEQR